MESWTASGRYDRKHHCLTFSRFMLLRVDVTSKFATMSSRFAMMSV